jgi:hypothetical protein
MTSPSPERQRGRHLEEIASRFIYPPTPDVARSLTPRLTRPRPALRVWQAVALAAVLLLTAVLVIPRARALIRGYFQIGAVRIFPFLPTATPAPILVPPLTSTPAPSPTAKLPTLLPSATAFPSPPELQGLAGETTFADAQRRAGFPVLVPAYPADLGAPDHVYYQAGFPMVVLAWSDPADPGRLRMSLYAIDSSSPIISKFAPDLIQETSVNGQPAVWARGPYLLELAGGNLVQRRLVEGPTLIWDVNGVTYRLESGLPLEEAVKVAESLHSLEPAQP